MTPDDLRKLMSNSALAKQKIFRLEQEERKIAEQHRADTALALVEPRAKQAALDGKNKVCVFKLTPDELNADGNGFAKANPALLTGAPLIVFNAAKEQGFNPTLEVWWDGNGMERSYYEIWIHW